MAFSSGKSIVTSGLHLLLDVGNSKSYPGSGNTWNDLMGNYTFTTVTPPTFMIDAQGVKCFDFTTGNHEYFQSTTNSPFSGGAFAITVTAIINENSRNSYQGILTQNYSDTDDCMGFVSYTGKFGTDQWRPTGRKIDSTPTANTIRMVTWVIPEWTYHKTVQSIYFGDTEQASSAYGTGEVNSLVAQPFIVGNWQISRDDMDFDGQIYYIAVYNRVLSQIELTQNYNVLRKRFGI